MYLLVYILVLSALVSTLYWIVLFIKLSSFKEPIRYGNISAPSILLTAKNEQDILSKTLKSLSSQVLYKEIVIMDDFSTDSTPQIIQQFAYNQDKIKTYQPLYDRPGKKQSLTEGVNHSISEFLLLTDADCQPRSNQWSSIIMSKMSAENQLVLGYGPFYKRPGFLNRFARFETVLTALQYMGLHLLGMTYMGVGRNMAFAKALFQKTKGYESHQHIPSGDDDLFVQEAVLHTHAQITMDPDSFVYSEAPDSLKKYIKQKKRHVGSSSAYKWIYKLVLGIHPAFHLICFFVSLALIFNGDIFTVVYVWLSRWILLMFIGYKPYSRLDGKDLIKWLPVLDIVLIAYYLFFGLTGIGSKNARW